MFQTLKKDYMTKRVIIIGSAHPLRGGGIATFNERLAKAYADIGYDVSIVSFSLQYPSFLFPGKSQYTDEPAPENLKIHTWLNSINPFNWIITARKIKKLAPDILIVRFWIPFMGPSLGSVCRLIKRKINCRIVAVVDNAIPHEHRIGDKVFTKWFLKSVDAYVTMSKSVLNDLHFFDDKKPRIYTAHPLYDNFGRSVSKEEACEKLGINSQTKYLLFFGFIREYKGLDILLHAISKTQIKNLNFKLIIAGEFYANEKFYHELIDELDIKDKLILHTQFISNDDVKYYFSASDLIVQPYKNATQSGVTQVAYHFEKPILTTNVGGLAEIVIDEKTGFICEPNDESVANGILKFFEISNANTFAEHIKEEKNKYSWDLFIEKINELCKDIN